MDLLQSVRDAVHVLLVDLRPLLGRHAQGHSPVPFPIVGDDGRRSCFCIISSALEAYLFAVARRAAAVALHQKNRAAAAAAAAEAAAAAAAASGGALKVVRVAAVGAAGIDEP